MSEFKILWVDDEFEDDLDLFQEDAQNLKEEFPDLNFSFDNVTGMGGISFEQVADYDLILTDYNLEDVSETGIDIIKEINGRSFIGDIILYSENEEITAEQDKLDEISHYSFSRVVHKRSNIYSNLVSVIRKSVKYSLDILLLRGLVLEEVIELENRLNELLLLYYLPGKNKEFLKDILENRFMAIHTKVTSLKYLKDRLEDPQKTEVKSICRDIQHVQEKRNEFAHYRFDKVQNKLICGHSQSEELTGRDLNDLRKKIKLIIIKLNKQIRVLKGE